MKTRNKALLLSLCAVLLVAASVFGTMAYLTDETDAVENTFTVGDVAITLDEAPVDDDGIATTGDRVTANEYKLFPAHVYDKDPTVHVDDESEDCWIFVQVVNGIAAIESTATDYVSIADQMEANGWTEIDSANHIFAYKETVSAGDDVVVFESFAVDKDLDGTDLASYASATITVTAYAVQADGFDTAEDAWEEAALL